LKTCGKPVDDAAGIERAVGDPQNVHNFSTGFAQG
jgi:hypothetical protein